MSDSVNMITVKKIKILLISECVFCITCYVNNKRYIIHVSIRRSI